MITGELTGLRAVEKEDLAVLRDWRNYPEFRRNFREIRELSMYDQERWIANVNANPSRDFMFVVVDLKTGRPIGAAGLLYINWIIRSADFSFYIGDQKKYIDEEGYAYDAAKLLIRYGFEILNLNKIWMELYEFDAKKIKFFEERFSFSRDGELRDNCFVDGRYWNSYIISLLKKEYSGN